MSKYEHCHHCRWELLFSCFSPQQHFCWGMRTLLSNLQTVLPSNLWGDGPACLPACIRTTGAVLLPQVFAKREDKIKPTHGSNIWALVQWEQTQNVGRGNHLKWHAFSCTLTNSIILDRSKTKTWSVCLWIRLDVRAEGSHIKAWVGPVVEAAQSTPLPCHYFAIYLARYQSCWSVE